MFAHKEPIVKENKFYQGTRACTICGFEIDDEFCSKNDKNLCPECGMDICFVNKKHKVIDRFCTVCKKAIPSMVEYQRWINSKLPFCDAKIQKIE